MIQFHNVSKRYPGSGDVLRNLEFELQSDEMAFLTGHSGAGKSTLLKLIAALERPNRGQCIVNNKNITRLPAWRIPYFRRDIGIVFQDHKLLMDRSVFDNVALPMVVAGFDHRDIKRRVNAALDKVSLLEKAKHLPITLSGGQQQRVGIARAVVNKPPLLLADEPTGNLDEELSDEIMDLFQDFNEHGVSVLIATHDVRQLRRMNKRILQLKDGELVFDGFIPAT